MCLVSCISSKSTYCVYSHWFKFEYLHYFEAYAMEVLMTYKYIIRYANFFDNSAISLVNVDVVFFSDFS